jgi:hypothetical protein
MNYKNIIALALFFSALSTASASSPPSESLGTLGESTVQSSEFRALNWNLPDATYSGLLRDRSQLVRSVETLLQARKHSSATQTLNFDQDEKSYQRAAADRANLEATLAIIDARARKAALVDSAGLERRAEEIWLITAPSELSRDMLLDFQHIVFDIQRRPFADAVTRIGAAQAALAAGKSFDDVVVEFSDDQNAAQTKGIFTAVPANTIGDPALSRALLETLKIGEHSQPIPSRRGIHIVRLIAKTPPAKRPFAEVKEAIIARLVQEAVQKARISYLETLSAGLSINNEAVDRIWIRPSQEAQELAKKIAAENAERNRQSAPARR